MRFKMWGKRSLGSVWQMTVLGVGSLAVLAQPPSVIAGGTTLEETVQWLKNTLKVHGNIEMDYYEHSKRKDSETIKTSKWKRSFRLVSFSHCVMTLSEKEDFVSNKIIKNKKGPHTGSTGKEFPAKTWRATGTQTIPFGSLTFFEVTKKSKPVDRSKTSSWSEVPLVYIESPEKIIKETKRREIFIHWYRWQNGVYEKYKVEHKTDYPPNANQFSTMGIIEFNEPDIAAQAGKAMERLTLLCGGKLD